jgi:DNA excision repair protein ERCC-3
MLLLEVQKEWAPAARNALCSFALLEHSPEYIHTYRISPLSLWNAAASGITGEWILEALDRFSRYPVPELVRHGICEHLPRFGRATLLPWSQNCLLLRVEEPAVSLELDASADLKPYWVARRHEVS